jgi:two-component system, LytTR family, sensor kinase
MNSIETRARRRDGVLWATLGASLALAALTAAALWLTEAPPPPAGIGPSLPRMRGPTGPLEPGALLRGMGVGSLTWYMCLAAAPGFVLLSRRLRFDRGRWPTSIAVVALAIIGLVLVTALVQYRFSYGGSPLAPSPGTYLRAALLTGTVPFLAVAALALALDARARAHERELEAARVRGQLAEARLEALTAQLQPHFLFNTLQGVSTLIRRDPEAADRMLTRLSDLLRDVLLRGDRQEVPLEEELDVLAPYLDIAGWRFG